MLTPREKSPIPEKILLRGGSNPRRCVKQDSEPNTLPTCYSGPRDRYKDRDTQTNRLTDRLTDGQAQRRSVVG